MPKQRKDEPVDWREGRGMQAWELHQHGCKQKDIAAALGVTQGAVSQWITRDNDGGVSALPRRIASGSAPRLRIEQREQLCVALAKGAPAFGFAQPAPDDVWTTKRIAAVINDLFGVSNHPAHVSRSVRVLRQRSQVPHNPLNATMLPSIRGTPSARPHAKKGQVEGRTIVWVDEAGFYLLPARVGTYTHADRHQRCGCY